MAGLRVRLLSAKQEVLSPSSRHDTEVALAISDVSMHDNVTASIMYSTRLCDAAKAVAYTLVFQGTMSLLESETTSIYPAFASPTAATRAKAYRLYTTQKRRAPSYFYCGSAGGAAVPRAGQQVCGED